MFYKFRLIFHFSDLVWLDLVVVQVSLVHVNMCSHSVLIEKKFALV